MSLDNKIDAVRAIVKAEQQDAATVADQLQKAVEYLPGPFSKIAQIALGTVTVDRMGQVEYMLRVYGDEIKRVVTDLDKLSASQQNTSMRITVNLYGTQLSRHLTCAGQNG